MDQGMNCDGSGQALLRGPTHLGPLEENMVEIPICPRKFIDDDVIILSDAFHLSGEVVSLSEQRRLPSPYTEAICFYKSQLIRYNANEIKKRES